MFNSKSKFILSILAVIFILSADVYLFWLIDKTSLNITEIGTNIDHEMKVAESNLLTRQQLNKTKSDRSKLDIYLIPHDGEVAFIEEIETLGRRVGVKVLIDGVNFEAVKNSSSTPSAVNLEIIKVKLEAAGTWNEINSYLYLIENMPYRLTINRVDTVFGLDPTTVGKSTRRVWNLSADISVYKQK